ncbi:MAG: ATP synthase F1 subunit epsilon [Candidatus Moranbacteria bacterium]|nr:ATP synthase F1 subunit epsilon [Candidatus Moranbacteria bacterium]
MKTFTFYLVTPERKVYEKKALQITLPVLEGEITILPDHIPYIGALKAGEIIVQFENGSREYIAISSGFIEFSKNRLAVLVDTAEKSEEIDEERVKKAIERAREAKEKKQLNETEYALLASKLEKEFARLRVVRRKK